MSHQCGNSIVITKPNFVAGNRVVLVDDRHATQLQQTQHGLPRVQILITINEVIRHEQHLGTHQAVLVECGVVVAHQATLPGSSQSLQRARVGGPLGKAEGCYPTGHCTTGHHEHLVTR